MNASAFHAEAREIIERALQRIATFRLDDDVDEATSVVITLFQLLQHGAQWPKGYHPLDRPTLKRIDQRLVRMARENLDTRSGEALLTGILDATLRFGATKRGKGILPTPDKIDLVIEAMSPQGVPHRDRVEAAVRAVYDARVVHPRVLEMVERVLTYPRPFGTGRDAFFDRVIRQTALKHLKRSGVDTTGYERYVPGAK